MSSLWPIGILLFSNVMYNVCAKKLPADLNPIAALTVVYGVAIVVSIIVYYVLFKDANIIGEIKKSNWTVFALAFCIVGMEVGTFYMYRVGWPISVGMLISNSCLAIILVLIGYFFFHEAITATKIAGIVCVLGGIYLINK